MGALRTRLELLPHGRRRSPPARRARLNLPCCSRTLTDCHSAVYIGDGITQEPGLDHIPPRCTTARADGAAGTARADGGCWRFDRGTQTAMGHRASHRQPLGSDNTAGAGGEAGALLGRGRRCCRMGGGGRRPLGAHACKLRRGRSKRPGGRRVTTASSVVSAAGTAGATPAPTTDTVGATGTSGAPGSEGAAGAAGAAGAVDVSSAAGPADEAGSSRTAEGSRAQRLPEGGHRRGRGRARSGPRRRPNCGRCGHCRLSGRCGGRCGWFYFRMGSGGRRPLWDARLAGSTQCTLGGIIGPR